jgi:hypothetical protein
VGIALILVLSTIISDDAANRFDHGKQVLTTMIGILGTIVGFYFATLAESGQYSRQACGVVLLAPPMFQLEEPEGTL